MPATRPEKPFRQARKASCEALATGTAKIEPIVARTVSSENGSVVSPIRITPFAPTASTVRMTVPRLPGSRTRSSATQTSPSCGADVLQRQEPLREDADDRLRIVAPGDGGQHLLRHFEHRAAGGDRARRDLFDRRVAARRLGEDQRPDRPAEVERVDDQLQPLGHEGVLLVAEFLQRQRLDVLDQRIGEAGDFLDLARRAAGALPAHGVSLFGGHAAIQRENSEVDSARPADFSRMISSPDSTVPPMPAKVSRISAWMAKNEARIE